MALILTRRVGEMIKIGDEIEVVVMAVNGNQVRVGIKAPKHIAVHREEIAERIRKEKDVKPFNPLTEQERLHTWCLS